MGGKFVASVFVALVLVAATVNSGVAGPIYVATAQNLKGLLFTGYGPTPDHAGQMALSGCSRQSFLPITCKVVDLHAEFPPPPPPQMMQPMPKYRKSAAREAGIQSPIRSAAPETVDRPVKKPRAVVQSRRPESPQRASDPAPAPTTAPPSARAESRPGMQETTPGGGRTDDAKYQWGKPLHSN
jgi:hypothetical protein